MGADSGGTVPLGPGQLESPPRSYSLSLIQVTSYLVVTQRRIRSASGSVEALRALSKKVLLHNLLFGWWGFPFGFVWTPAALLRNFTALRQLRELEASGRTIAGWYDDPTGRHVARYWDGAAWTERVTDTAIDPLDADPMGRVDRSGARLRCCAV